MSKRLLPFFLHGLSLLPLMLLILNGLNGRLTANPIQAITQRTGQAAILLLLFSLGCSPLQNLTGWRFAGQARRPLGLYAFFYAILHFLTFAVLDYGLNLALIGAALLEKRFILVGALALLLLLALAVTSNQAAMRSLGRNWKRLHRFAYLAGILAILHYLWAVKSDIRQPLLYGSILLILLSLRLPPIRRWLSRLRHRT
jgi:sulfoxide reductase heme-binding subunit YedZ